MMKRIVRPALLLCCAVAPAFAVAAQAPTPTRFPGVSEAGNAALAKAQTAPDPQRQALIKQVRAAHEQLTSTIMAPAIDVEKVAAALRQEDAAQAQLRTYNNDRLINVVKQLPEEDRGTFLRTLLLSRRSGATPSPAPQP